jgi:DNA-binding FadR family transcriptional regulator
LEKINRPKPLHLSVQDAIKEYITDNNLHAGDPLLPETELAKRLGVSRNSIREGVKALESMGILETRRGIGVFVRDFSFDPILDNLPYGLLQDLKVLSDLLEIRQVLETGMIAKIVPMVSDQDLEELHEVLSQMKSRANKGEPFREEDREFHRKLFQNANNDVLIKLLDLFWLTFSKTSAYADLEDRYPMQTYLDHAAIVDAIADGNVNETRSALTQHYTSIQERLGAVKTEE